MRTLLFIDAVDFSVATPLTGPAEIQRWVEPHLHGIPDLALKSIAAADRDLETAAAEARGIILGGSPRDAWSDDPVITRLIGLLRIAIMSGQPVLGICFGHQLLARAFGGVVERHPSGWEVGETPITLTPAGVASPLFAGIPSPFKAIASHQDAVLSLPPDALLLAGNPHTPVQAFSIGAKGFGVQFHPEMNGEILRDIWTERREKLDGETRAKLDAVLTAAWKTPEAAQVLRNFAALLPSSL